MINFVIAFVLATIIYLIAIRYLQNFCPMSKFFKLIIYVCISTVSLPAVNYIHPPKDAQNGILSSIERTVSGEENGLNSDWQAAQQKANTLVNGNSSQTDQTNDDFGSGYQKDTETSQQTDDQSQDIIIGINGEVLS